LPRLQRETLEEEQRNMMASKTRQRQQVSPQVEAPSPSRIPPSSADFLRTTSDVTLAEFDE
jgi:hypothetical protein